MEKYFLFPGEIPAQGISNTKKTAEVKCSTIITITKSRKKFCLNVHYNGYNSFFVC